MSDARTCDQCRSWEETHPYSHPPGATPRGQCRRFPPTGVWPITWADYWCGEWEAKANTGDHHRTWRTTEPPEGQEVLAVVATGHRLWIDIAEARSSDGERYWHLSSGRACQDVIAWQPLPEAPEWAFQPVTPAPPWAWL